MRVDKSITALATFAIPTGNYTGAGTAYPVVTAAGAIYDTFVNVASDAVYSKSSDGGASFGAEVLLRASTMSQIAVWYDRWSGIAGGLIHTVFTDSGGDVWYRSIDTENADTLSTAVRVFDGVSPLAGGALSIARARGGNLYVKACVDAGTEGGFFRSTDAGATWAARTDSEALATQDQWILLPGWGADNQDMMMFFWDASADEISRVLYDDSADTWAETSIATTMVDRPASNDYPHFAATVDTSNSRNLLAAWPATDTANADLRCWHITDSAITEVTNVVLNSVDDQGFCAIAIDTSTEDWYVFYGGQSSGNDTFNSSMSLFYKKSTDDGSTWGAETEIGTIGRQNLRAMWAVPRVDSAGGVPLLKWISGTGAVTLNLEIATGGSVVAPLFGGGIVN